MKHLIVAAAVLAASGVGVVRADAFELASSCAACHALTKPTDTSMERAFARKGPDLWYAGSKFKAEWLTAWLQDPKPIRPAGYPFFANLKEGTDHDEVDASKLTPHPKLAKADAEAASAALMALTAPDLVSAGGYKGDASSARMGAMAFTKLRGCASCHSGEGGQGGLSGPELTDAGARLQADFVVAYTADPQRFDPHVSMPTQKLSDQDLQRLAGYLATLGSGDK